MSQCQALFRNHDFLSQKESWKQQAREKVGGWPPGSVLEGKEEEVIEGIFSVVAPVVISLDEKEMRQDTPKEVYMEGSDDFGDGPTIVTMMEYTIRVPFKGTRELFQCRPTQRDPMPPHADVEGRNIVFRYRQRCADVEELKRMIYESMTAMKRYVEWINADVRAFEDELRTCIAQCVQARRQQLKNAYEASAGLDIPVDEG